MDARAVAGAITDAVLSHRTKSVHDLRDRLISDNAAKGNPHYGFLYGGEFHTQYDPRQLTRAHPRKLLHKDLHEAGREYLAELKLYREDDTRLRQGLVMPITTNCSDMQDVRDLMPEIIAPLVPDFEGLPRTRPVGWAFADKPIQGHAFQAIVDLLEFHAAIRIL